MQGYEGTLGVEALQIGGFEMEVYGSGDGRLRPCGPSTGQRLARFSTTGAASVQSCWLFVTLVAFSRTAHVTNYVRARLVWSAAARLAEGLTLHCSSGLATKRVFML